MYKKTVAVVGSNGFVGSALCKKLSILDNINLISINKSNYNEYLGNSFDILIEAACNSKKYLADENPINEAKLSIIHRLKTLTDFNTKFHIHLSSVDVYHNLSIKEHTNENTEIISSSSNYGSHKLLSESLVKHYAKNWLIFRLSGMVGEGLRKNPVYDIMNNKPLFINPQSEYQYMSTNYVAESIIKIYETGIQNEIFNMAGAGLISPQKIAEIFNKNLIQNEESKTQPPRIVNIDCSKIAKFIKPQNTEEVIREFHRLSMR